MRTLNSRSRSSRLAWLALSGLGVMALVLGGGVWVALRVGDWGTGPQRFVDACLLVAQSVAEPFWSWTMTRPLTVLVLAFLAASMVWALVRFGLSLLGGWRVGRQLSSYEAGQFPLLDRALRLTPELAPARVRIFHSMTPEAFTIGLVRPKICVSVGLLQSVSEAELEAVLRHEHAHVTTRDPLRLASVRLLSDFLWFLPITRTLAEAFSGLTEFRADEAAVSARTDSLELASAIVKTARGAFARPRLAPALGDLALVERRIMRLLGRELTIPVRIRWGPSLASGLMIATVLALLVGPAVGTPRGRSLDPMVSMHSMMMNCSAENTARVRQPMSFCTDSGNVPPQVRKGFRI